MTIRMSQNEDFEMIFSLLKQLWPDNDLHYETLNEVYLKGIKSEVQQFILGELDGKIIGFCSLTIKNNLWQGGNLGYIDELVVDKVYRGQGLGKQLLNAITTIAKEYNCKRIELVSAFHRKEAHLFYETLGYEKSAFLFSKKLS